MMRRERFLFRIAIRVSLTFSLIVPVHAQDNAGVKVADIAGHLDLAVPQSPAFTILGLTPEYVVMSDDLRTVSAGLLHGLDASGNLQGGVAIDVRPYLALEGDRSTLGDYQRSRAVRIASNSQLSFATASGQSDDDKADRQALGINLKLWREHDPALNRSSLNYKPVKQTAERPVGKDGLFHGTVGDCYGDYLLAGKTPDVFPEGEAAIKAEEAMAAEARKTVESCLKPFKEQHWNAGALELAIGGYRSEVLDLEENGFGAWLGYSHSIGSRGQVIARASYADNRLVASKATQGAYDVVDQTDAGARLRYGSSKGTVMVEGSWTRAKVGDAGVEDDYYRAALGAELMVFKDVWVQLAVGKAFSTELFDKDPVYSGQVRFGFSEKSLIGGK